MCSYEIPSTIITRSIKKVLYGFQNIDSLFASLKSPVTFKGYLSADETLPDALKEFRTELQTLLDELKEQSNGAFDFAIIDPEAGDGTLAKEIGEKYGFRPMVAGLFDPTPFYFYLTLQGGDKIVQLGLPEEFNKESMRKGIEAGLKRFSSGFLKTIGLYAKGSYAPSYPGQGFAGGGKRYSMLREKLEQSYSVRDVNLEDGVVPRRSRSLPACSGSEGFAGEGTVCH